jgi:hypothetical protein
MEVLSNFNAATLTGVGVAAPSVSGTGGTVSAGTPDADGNWINLNPGNSSGNDAIYANYSLLRRDWLPEIYIRIKTPAATASSRYWVGFFSADPSGAATNNTIHSAAFRFDTSASDTNWQFCTGDGTTQACTDTSVAVTASTAYSLWVICSASDCKGYINGVLKATRNTNLPGSTTTVGYAVAVSSLANGSGKSLSFGRVTILHK